jgi:pimeloyl-ACP methyl ester carboxylesterase
VRANSLLAAGLARTYRFMPRAAGYVHTSIFANTRALGRFPNDLRPLGARQIDLCGVPRVSAVYLWGHDEPAVLALHGWGADSTTMLNVAHSALANGQSTICFDAPGHGISPGSQATLTEYSDAVISVLQRFPSIRTIVAHSLGSIAAVSALARCRSTNISKVLLLAPTCTLAGVMNRWASQRGLADGLLMQMYRESLRRNGFPMSYWDIRTLGLPSEIELQILHDPTDEQVPVTDSYQIAAAISAEVCETAPGTGHYGVLSCGEMHNAVALSLKSGTDYARRSHV